MSVTDAASNGYTKKYLYIYILYISVCIPICIYNHLGRRRWAWGNGAARECAESEFATDWGESEFVTDSEESEVVTDSGESEFATYSGGANRRGREKKWREKCLARPPRAL